MGVSRVFRFNKNRIFVLGLIVLLISVALLPFLSTLAATTVCDEIEDTGGSRGRGGVNEIISGTTIGRLDPKTEYGSVWVKDNATLVFDKAGTTYSIKGRLNVTDNANVIIKKGTVEVFTVTVHCKSFKMEGGILRCKNNNELQTDDGLDTNVIIHTQEGIKISGGAEIEVEGTRGFSAINDEVDSHNGGNGLIDLMCTEFIRITDGSKLICTGGGGGTGIEDEYQGGEGGNGIIKIQANGTNSSTKQSIY